MTMMFVLIVSVTSSYALDVPVLKGRVNDYANMLKAQEIVALEKKLEEREKATSNQVVVLTIPSLEGEVLEEFSIKVAEKWKIGLGAQKSPDGKARDNGVIITIAKKERKVRIEVGYGLEGSLTDLLAGRIISNEIIPQFKNGNYYEGVNAGVDNVFKAIAGEYKGEGKTVKKKDYTLEIALGALVLIAGICGFIHFLIGGVVGAVGAPIIAIGVMHMSMGLIIPAIIAGFLLGMASRFILELGLMFTGVGGGGSFGGGGGGFGGGGASGDW